MLEHPEYMSDGVSLSQFSFQIPKPLQENYVRKRTARPAASCDGTRPIEPGEGMQTNYLLLKNKLKSYFL
jgi:hypothetical protein